MGDTGIGEVTQILSLGMNGVSMGFKATKEGVSAMLRFGIWLNNKMATKNGIHGTEKFKKQFAGEYFALRIPDQEEEKRIWEKALNEITAYTEVDKTPHIDTNGYTDYLIPNMSAVEVRIKYEEYKNDFFERKRKQGCMDPQKEYGSLFGESSLSEVMTHSGMADCDEKEFDDLQKRIAGKDALTLENYKNTKKNDNKLEVKDAKEKIVEKARWNDYLKRDDIVVIKPGNVIDSVIDLNENTLTLKDPKDSSMIYTVTAIDYSADYGLAIEKKENVLIESTLKGNGFSSESTVENLKKYMEKQQDLEFKIISLDSNSLFARKTAEGDYVFRIPRTGRTLEMTIPAENVSLHENQKTYFAVIDTTKELPIFNRKTNKKDKMLAEDILKHFDDVNVSQKATEVIKDITKNVGRV